MSRDIGLSLACPLLYVNTHKLSWAPLLIFMQRQKNAHLHSTKFRRLRRKENICLYKLYICVYILHIREKRREAGNVMQISIGPIRRPNKRLVMSLWLKVPRKNKPLKRCQGASGLVGFFRETRGRERARDGI